MAKRAIKTTAHTAAAAAAALAALDDTDTAATTPAVFTAPAGGGQIVFRPLDRLDLSPKNERTSFDQLELIALSEDIAQRGLLQNLVVYPHPDIEDMDLVAGGGRRWRAMRLLAANGQLPEMLAVHGIPCRRLADEREALVATIVENMRREDVHFLDRAAAFARLRDELGWTNTQIGQSVNLGNDAVGQYLRVHDRLDEDMRAAARRGEMNFKQAREAVAEKRENQLVATEYYAGMSLAELHQAEADIDALTPAHRDALKAEIDRRYDIPAERPLPLAAPEPEPDAADYDDALFDRVVMVLSNVTQIAETDIYEDDDLTENLHIAGSDQWTLLSALRDEFGIPVGRTDLTDCGIKTVADLVRHVQAIVEAGKHRQDAMKTRRTTFADLPTTELEELWVQRHSLTDFQRQAVDAEFRSRERWKGLVRWASGSTSDELRRTYADRRQLTHAARQAIEEEHNRRWPAGDPARTGGMTEADIRERGHCFDVQTNEQLTTLWWERRGLTAASFVSLESELKRRGILPCTSSFSHGPKGLPEHLRQRGELVFPLGDFAFMGQMSSGATGTLALYFQERSTGRRFVAKPEQSDHIDLEEAIALKTAAEEISVAVRVRSVLAHIGGFDASIPVQDSEDLYADCAIGADEAVKLGAALAEEFGFARPPFVADPDAPGGGLAEIGLGTVGDLVAFLERRLAATAGE